MISRNEAQGLLIVALASILHLFQARLPRQRRGRLD
jgi:hypothetical protein